jgi:hypothetical protein
MDKIIKTLTSDRWVSFKYRNKKREKIKKLFRSFVPKESNNDAQTNISGQN